MATTLCNTWLTIESQPRFAFRCLSALGNLQVVTLDAFCCVLHRAPSQDIHRGALSTEKKGEPRQSLCGSQGSPRTAKNPRITKEEFKDSSTSKSKGKSENDPAAGSPTATLLRLLPLLDCKYCQISTKQNRGNPDSAISKRLYSQPITGNDGRCVQEPGTYSVRSDETRLQDIPRSWRIISSINPHHDFGSKFPQPLRARLQGKKLAVEVSVLRVQPSTFRSITDLLWALVSMRF